MKNIHAAAQSAQTTVNPWSVIKRHIDPDGYTATATVYAAFPNATITYGEILEFLKSQQVVYGIIPEAIQELVETVKNGEKDKTVIVAKGAPLEEGKDGIADYKFNIKLLAGRMDNKRIDFKERGYINNVRAGQVIASIVPEVPGKPGMRVDGEVVAPRPVVKVVVPTAGPNVAHLQQGDAMVFTALKAGHARLLFDEIQVNPDLIISGDIDYSKGNIDFVGNLQIAGSVRSGFSVSADGNVIINGDVESGAVVASGKSLTVRKSINCGKGPGKVSCGADLTAARINNSLVECGGNIFVKDSVSDSLIYCDGKFATKYGKITGSIIEAVGGIVVNTVGIEQGTSENRLLSGVSFTVAKRLKEVDASIERCEHDQSLLVKQVAKQSDRQGDDAGAQAQNLNRAKLAAKLKEDLESLRREKAMLLPRMKTDVTAKITVSGCIYPSCFVTVGKKEVKILDAKVGAQTFADLPG